MSLVLGSGFDVVGDDEDDDDVMGEGNFVLGAGRRGRGRKKIKVPTPRWMNATTSQGVSRPEEDMDFLPFSQLVLTALLPTGFIVASPQRPFRPERLVLAAFRETGADASVSTVIDPAIYVGAVQVGAAQGATPIGTFSATAFGVRLTMPATGQGTDIKIFLRNSAIPVAPATVTVTGVLIGRAMR